MLKRGFLKGTQFVLCFIINISFLFHCPEASANNLSITNVALKDRNPTANTVVVQFDLTWSNSWRTKINHDAAWLTVRLQDPSVNPSYKKLCNLTGSGLNPSGNSVGSNSGLELYVPADKTGAFVRRSTYGGPGTVSSTSVQIKVDYTSCGFSDEDQVSASVFGIEMVLVPQGEFYAGDYNTSTASLSQGSSDADPWYISSEDSISVTNPAANGYRYASAGQSGENATGDAFSIPAAFPKGYQAFYVMKYEVTEGEWVEFINSLPSAGARTNRDLTNNSHKNSDSTISRNTISCTGSPLSCSTARSDRAASYLSWMDLAAFLDWAALRPITELEYEKAARGPLMAVGGEYAWGTSVVTAADALSGNEDGSETVTTSDANAHFSGTSLTGGDGSQGPLRVGIFATSSSSRDSAGSGYYGPMELSGNLTERTVTVGNAAGRAFTGGHGDGYLSTVSGYEGNANVTGWVEMDGTDSSRGVTGAIGSGLRGGSWSDPSTRLRTSDRSQAAATSTAAQNNFGGRGVRTYDGN